MDVQLTPQVETLRELGVKLQDALAESGKRFPKARRDSKLIAEYRQVVYPATQLFDHLSTGAQFVSGVSGWARTNLGVNVGDLLDFGSNTQTAKLSALGTLTLVNSMVSRTLDKLHALNMRIDEHEENRETS